MKVSIIKYDKNFLKLICDSARVCYGKDEFEKELNKNNYIKRIKRFIELGHHSVLEHATLTLKIEDISRVCSHQLVRHRIGVSPTQQSQRYTKYENGEEVYIPDNISIDKSYFEPKFKQHMMQSHILYEDFIKRGISIDDARYLLPSAFFTNLVITLNIRSLRHFVELRISPKASEEINKLIVLVYNALVQEDEDFKVVLDDVYYKYNPKIIEDTEKIKPKIVDSDNEKRFEIWVGEIHSWFPRDESKKYLCDISFNIMVFDDNIQKIYYFGFNSIRCSDCKSEITFVGKKDKFDNIGKRTSWEVKEWPKDFPEEYKSKVIDLINANIPFGVCCGGKYLKESGELFKNENKG